jgi:putative addiction module component (TIGR02574 family)
LTFALQARRAATKKVVSRSIALVLSKPHTQSYHSLMATIVEVEKLALNLTEHERAQLAADLLHSLPAVLSDEDEGVAEALRRDAQIEANPNQTVTLAQLDSQIQSRRS